MIASGARRITRAASRQRPAVKRRSAMANPVLILHGWSDNYQSFEPLKAWFRANGYTAESVFLADYESMEDHVTFDDLAVGFHVRLDALVRASRLPTLQPHSLDVIVHSTGGPVFRHWLAYYLTNVCGGDQTKNPIRTAVMLAPANFGSRLAAQGKSALAMLFKGGVELGSPELWAMAERDLFSDDRLYPTDPAKGPFVFILSGTSTYGHLKGLAAKGANEDGSDGTVRASAAALNCIRLDLDFLDPTDPSVTVRLQKNEPFALRLVPGKNHSTLVPDDPAASHPTFDLIRQCFAVQDVTGYRQLRQKFEQDNAAFYATQATLGEDEAVHGYQQFIFHVRDELDNDVEDYRIAFHVVDETITHSAWSDPVVLQGLQRYQAYTTVLQEEVIVDVQPHTVNPSYRTFFVNLDKLDALRAELRQKFPKAYIGMNLDATGPTNDLTYNTDPLKYLPVDVPIPVDGSGNPVSFFARNTSTLVDIKISRIPTDRIFAWR